MSWKECLPEIAVRVPGADASLASRVWAQVRRMKGWDGGGFSRCRAWRDRRIVRRGSIADMRDGSEMLR